MDENVIEKEAISQPIDPDSKNNEAEVPALSEFDHKMLDNDLKFRGPLSYRYLRVIAWLAMALTFVSTIIGLVLASKTTLAPDAPNNLSTLETINTVASFISALPLPLFMIANFAIILQSRNNFKQLIKLYLILLVAIYIGFIFVYYHYVVIVLMRVGEISFWDARRASTEIFAAIGKQNGLVVNIFVDLLCCALIMYFVEYNPQKYFQGKKIILFRLLVLLPLLYEVGSAILVGLMTLNANSLEYSFSLPPEILPLIGKKPIGMIIAFFFICLYVKFRGKIYMKRGGTEEGYKQYVHTNRNSLRFSIVMSIIFLTISIIDLLIVLIPVIAVIAKDGNQENGFYLIDILEGFSIGKSFCLILVIPFILLFSYTKQHKNPKIDRLLPIGGVAFVGFAALETLFFTLLF